MNGLGIPGIQEFLMDYPNMTIRPTQSDIGLILIGAFDFSAKFENNEEIIDSYRISIVVPHVFPRDIPVVKEIDGKFPHTEEYHVNSDGTLCLGSRIRLLLKITSKPTICGFAEECLIPYLYAVSYKSKFGGKLLFSELPHGPQGELLDYIELFGLKETEQVRKVLQLLPMKKRIANKYPCPCGCGQRLGKCKFNDKIKYFRNLADRNWFQSLLSYHNDIPFYRNC